MTILPNKKKVREHPREGAYEKGTSHRKEDKSDRQPLPSSSRHQGLAPPSSGHVNQVQLPADTSPPPRKFARKGSPAPGPSKSPRHGTTRDEKEDEGAANSDDEYDKGFKDDELEKKFEVRLKEERGLEIKEMAGDGACLFRAVAHQVYGDQKMHGEVRRQCMDYMERNREHFEQFITEDFEAYIERKRRPTVHGNHLELQGISEIYGRPIEIYEYSTTPINTFHPGRERGPGPSAEGAAVQATLRLSRHGRAHYNSVIDPNNRQIGVGLGLPSLESGGADKEVVAQALAKNRGELAQIEEAMLSDKMKLTDWERTEEDLKDQVARESYLEYVRSMEKKNEETNEKKSPEQKKAASPRRDPTEEEAGADRIQQPQPSHSLYEQLLAAEALDHWPQNETDDASALAQALVMSQETFFSDLRRQHPHNDET